MLYWQQKKVLRHEKYNELSAISELKVNQLVQWHQERLSEARFFSGNVPYTHYAHDIIRGSNDARLFFGNALKQIMTNNRYENILMFSEEGEILFSVDEVSDKADSSTIEYVKKVFADGSLTIRDFYPCKLHQKVHFDIIAPIFDQKKVIAALVFRINPRDYLYPLIKMWPTPSKSAETYIIRQDSDSGYYLNDLRHLANQNFQHGFPLDNTENIAVQAVSGYIGILDGTDYRGMHVLADIRPVPATDWYIISQIDNREVYAVLKKRAFLIAAFSLVAILFVGFVMAWLYNYRQRNMEIKLMESEKIQEENRQELNRLIGNLSGIAYRCKYDEQWPMEFISQGCETMTGYTAREFYSKTISWGSLIFEEDQNTVWDTISQNISKREHFQVEYRIQHRNGQKKWVWEKGIGIRDKQDRIIAIEGFITDVTERRETENALIESMKNYRVLIDGMNETVWIIGYDGNLIDVNHTASVDLGYTKEELLSIGLYGIDTTLKRESIDHLINTIPEDKIQIFETTHKTKDGRILPVEVYSSLVKYQGQKAILSIARNITRRKRDENIQLILYEIARTSTSAKAIDDLLVVVQKELSKVIDTTHFYVALYDRDSETLRKVVFSDEPGDNLEWKLKDTISACVVKTGKSLLLPRDQMNLSVAGIFSGLHERPAQCWLGVPLVDDSNVLGIIVVESYTDANAFDSNSVRLLEMIAHELAIMFQRRIMIEDLIRAKEKAEESDRLKMAFLANISHEIRTPMNGILGFLELLKRPDLDENKKEKFINLVNESGHRLLDTINNIIEISKIEAGQIDLNFTEVNLAEVMQYHYDFFRLTVLNKGLELEFSDMIGKKNRVLTDKFKLDAILTNLLNNAVKFTVSGKILFGNYLEGDQMVFYVKDTGMGIPSAKQDAIFERFVQADLNITRPYEGSGLGLSIVKAFIESLQGRIWVESDQGIGSAFYFSIPYKPQKITEQLLFQESPVAVIKDNLLLLIAEDDAVSYSYLETLLENETITLLHTVNGIETVSAVKENQKISMILMDIKMPYLNGLEATRQIREFNKTIPIIIQTAYAFANDKNKAIEAGCNEYISKPVDATTLMGFINKYALRER
jgi:PAS domain S-box-containing protein